MDKWSGRNNVTSDKVNFRSNIRQFFFEKKTGHQKFGWLLKQFVGTALCPSDVHQHQKISPNFRTLLLHGVRPIRIGEVLLRIVGKAEMSVVKKKVLQAASFKSLSQLDNFPQS